MRKFIGFIAGVGIFMGLVVLALGLIFLVFLLLSLLQSSTVITVFTILSATYDTISKAISAILTGPFVTIPTLPLKAYPPTFFWIISFLVGPIVLWWTRIYHGLDVSIRFMLVVTPFTAFVSTAIGAILWELVIHGTGLREFVILCFIIIAIFIITFICAFIGLWLVSEKVVLNEEESVIVSHNEPGEWVNLSSK